MTRQYAAVIFVAWNGGKCDLKWLWCLRQAPNAIYQMLEKLQYFIDPYPVTDKYTSCRINPTKSHIESLSLSLVYHFLFEEPLAGGHDTLVDDLLLALKHTTFKLTLQWIYSTMRYL
jgi:hypothetical protein